jgi:hypothetical protein
VTPASDAAPSRPPLVLSEEATRHLGRARGWAQFVAVVGFVFAGLLGLGLVASAIRAPGGGKMVFVAVTFAVLGGACALLAALAWGYAKGLVAFGAGDRGGLVAAFQSLRQLWVALAICQGLALLAGVGSLLLRARGR